MKATSVALLVAAVVLVLAVLPAEYGIDLIGTGRLLGLTSLADAGTGPIAPQDGAFHTETVEFVLGSYQFTEYKYRLESGASLQYRWEATKEVAFDFHSEPDGAPEGYAESFDKRSATSAAGAYTAPFSGIHGWYWENGGGGDVRIRLTTAGFYTASTEFRENGRLEKRF